MSAENAREIIAAVGAGNTERVRSLIQRDRSLLEAEIEPDWLPELPRYVSGMRLIHYATACDRPEVVELLIDMGADMNARNAEGRTALHDSIEDGRREVTALLRERGAHLDICAAAILGDLDRVRTLLDTDPTSANDLSTGLEPLGWAGFGDQVAVAELLIARGARITPGLLHIGASCDHARYISVLLAHGADPNTRERDGRTPLHTASLMPFTIDTTETVRVLLKAGADVNARDETGRTPSALALEGPNLDAYNHPSAAPQDRKRFDDIAELLRQHGGKV
ncbi:MAG: ankyrin repeat domain-containing protein [Candidatus Palauibacterales bacterium]|nr:ankyrin repeat domain-containing protein [Candidatus Palauibacterales bacterium]